jgi:Phosphotransferase enzyme family
MDVHEPPRGTKLVPGVTLAELPDDKKSLPIKELEVYVAQMHAIKSKVMGGFLDDVMLPYRVGKAVPHDEVLKFREATTPEFVLCHNDLSQHNVMVDETTFKINAILDWEYAGFFPQEFDGVFYLRPGPSGVALGGERDDVSELLEVLERWKA